MWKFGDEEIRSHDDLHPDCTDIVYVLYYDTGQRYIGKKSVRGYRELKPTKAQLATRKNYKRIEKKNLPFMKYEGSFKKDEDCPKLISKQILYQCSNKRTATYIEESLLFEVGAIFSSEYLNKSIRGVYFDNAADGYLVSYPEGL